MRRQLAKSGSLLRRFANATGGVAIVEFALVVPLLLVLYLGSIEASSLFTVDRRVTVISGTMGDLVSRWDPDAGNIPQATIDDYFTASEIIMTPYDPNGLGQVVSLVSVDSAGNTLVQWSEASGGATARTGNSSFPLAAGTQMNVISRGVGCFIASETTYSYTPALGIVFPNAVALAHTSYFLPRFGEESCTIEVS
ncbi:MAG: TadE/TadG family type IV pilus assembly protein [Devosia sp.]